MEPVLTLPERIWRILLPSAKRFIRPLTSSETGNYTGKFLRIPCSSSKSMNGKDELADALTYSIFAAD
jgi:hypothetical protein